MHMTPHPAAAKIVAWVQMNPSTLILTLLIHIHLPILSQHHIQPIVSACNKLNQGDKLGDNQQLNFEFFSIICPLIYPPPPRSLRDRDFHFKILSIFLIIENVKTLSPSLP